MPRAFYKMTQQFLTVAVSLQSYANDWRHVVHGYVKERTGSKKGGEFLD
jgi:hypothetical protein